MISLSPIKKKNGIVKKKCKGKTQHLAVGCSSVPLVCSIKQGKNQ